jgi:hypothetical protein
VVDSQLTKDLSHDYLWKHSWLPLRSHAGIAARSKRIQGADGVSLDAG